MFEHEHYKAKIHLKIGVTERIGCLTVCTAGVSVGINCVTLWYNRCQSLKVRADLEFFTIRQNKRSLIAITGSAADQNITELSQPEMSLTWIKVKIQCSSRTLSLLTNVFKLRKMDILYTNVVAAPMPRIKIHYHHRTHIF